MLIESKLLLIGVYSRLDKVIETRKQLSNM
jgi:hypothetical protein